MFVMSFVLVIDCLVNTNGHPLFNQIDNYLMLPSASYFCLPPEGSVTCII